MKFLLRGQARKQSAGHAPCVGHTWALRNEHRGLDQELRASARLQELDRAACCGQLANNRLPDWHPASDATGLTHNQISLQDDAPRSRIGLAGHSLKEQLNSQTSKCFGGLVNDGKSGREDRKVFYVVEAHKPHVFRNGKTALA